MNTIPELTNLANGSMALGDSVGVKICRDAIAEIEQLRTFRWQSMDAAPRDGTEVLLCVERRAGMSGRMLVGHYMPGGHCIDDHPPIEEGWYFWTGGMFDKASKPIRWMPLPEVAEAEGGGE